MTPHAAVLAFAAQLGRHTGIKVIVSPSPLKEPAPHAKVAVRKILRAKTPGGATSEYEVRLIVSADGRVESETGLKLAVEACTALVDYLSTVSRLEDGNGAPIASTRIRETVNEDDGILEDPENGNVAWIDDLHYVSAWIPV
jgi:hypothetical protein